MSFFGEKFRQLEEKVKYVFFKAILSLQDPR